MTNEPQFEKDPFRLNAEEHQRFEALCALSLSGELSSMDQARLDKHLHECAACRETLRELEGLTLFVLPAIGAAMEEEALHSELPSYRIEAAAESRLLSAIAAETSDEAIALAHFLKTERARHWMFSAAIAAALGLGVALGAMFVRAHERESKMTANAIVPPLRSTEPLWRSEAELAKAHITIDADRKRSQCSKRS